MPSERLYVGGGGEGKSSAADSVAAGGVPDDLAVQVSKRVAALALIIVIASLWALFKGKVLQQGASGELREPAYWGIGIALAASLAMGIVAWRTLLLMYWKVMTRKK